MIAKRLNHNKCCEDKDYFCVYFNVKEALNDSDDFANSWYNFSFGKTSETFS